MKEQPDNEEERKLLQSLLFRLSGAAKSTVTFISQNDLVLHPSQSLTLESQLLSSITAISSLHYLLQPLPSPRPQPTPPPTKTYWFLRFLASDSDNRWLEAFHMSRPSFYLLLQHLTPSLYGHSALPPPDHKLAAALFRLAHAAPYASLARCFGLADTSEACRVFYQVCRAVCDRLAHLLDEIPPDRAAIGYGRFGSSSMVVQAVVSPDGRFLDVSAGWNGAMSPAEILPRTKLFDLYAAKGKTGYLLGDSCCPLLPWLITPFGNPTASGESGKAFNDFHSHTMKIVGRAFGDLRARWGILCANREECAEALPFVLVATCLLHNFLIQCREPLPGVEVNHLPDVFARFEGEGSEDGRRVRGDLVARLQYV